MCNMQPTTQVAQNGAAFPAVAENLVLAAGASITLTQRIQGYSTVNFFLVSDQTFDINVFSGVEQSPGTPPRFGEVLAPPNPRASSVASVDAAGAAIQVINTREDMLGDIAFVRITNTGAAPTTFFDVRIRALPVV